MLAPESAQGLGKNAETRKVLEQHLTSRLTVRLASFYGNDGRRGRTEGLRSGAAEDEGPGGAAEAVAGSHLGSGVRASRSSDSDRAGRAAPPSRLGPGQTDKRPRRDRTTGCG